MKASNNGNANGKQHNPHLTTTLDNGQTNKNSHTRSNLHTRWPSLFTQRDDRNSTNAPTGQPKTRTPSRLCLHPHPSIMPNPTTQPKKQTRANLETTIGTQRTTAPKPLPTSNKKS
jgi:hypothetical protein